MEFGDALPAAHAVHVDAPLDPSVSVTDPAAQIAHALVDTAVYRPGAQAVHVVPFVLFRVSV